jgi:hypothetical protein
VRHAVRVMRVKLRRKMTGKPKTESERRAMRERCEKIAAKYRGSDENTTGWRPDWIPEPDVVPDAARTEPELTEEELAEASERRKRLYGGS